MDEAITKAVTDALKGLNIGNNMERLDKRISTLTHKVTELENCLATNDEVANGNINQAATRQAQLRQRLHENNQGMGGPHQQNHCIPNDPYAKIKFSIPSFSGYYDAEGYLDWEMMIEQNFSSHLVPEQHRVQQAMSEFKDFAIIWWNGLATQGALPSTWDQLKVAMCDHFVPPSYHRDLCKKLQRLEQGDKSVQDYCGELQNGLMRCSIVEENEDSICRFYSGFNHEIQDIVDYKEFNTINQLF
jgi:hypothetical protein